MRRASRSGESIEFSHAFAAPAFIEELATSIF